MNTDLFTKLKKMIRFILPVVKVIMIKL
jgi:hypothetical protein